MSGSFKRIKKNVTLTAESVREETFVYMANSTLYHMANTHQCQKRYEAWHKIGRTTVQLADDDDDDEYLEIVHEIVDSNLIPCFVFVVLGTLKTVN